MAHAGRHIRDADSDRVRGHLNAALVDSGAEDDTIRSVITAVSGLRTAVVRA